MPKRPTLNDDVELALEYITKYPGMTAINLWSAKQLKPLRGTHITNRRRIGTRWKQIRRILMDRKVITINGRHKGMTYHPQPSQHTKVTIVKNNPNPEEPDNGADSTPTAAETPQRVQHPTPDEKSVKRAANNANENYLLSKREREVLITNLEAAYVNVLDLLGIDLEGDPNSRGTPLRIAKMMVNETLHGRFHEPPSITTFPNDRSMEQMVMSGPIRIVSLCSHHWQPFTGEAFIAYIPGAEVLGLSKLSRISDYYSRRPQIQEELTCQIADHITEAIPSALGIAVLIRCQHQCMTCRGVNDPNACMTTSELRGAFQHNPSARQEFFALVQQSRR